MSLFNSLRTNRLHAIVIVIFVGTFLFLFALWRQRNPDSRLPLPATKSISVHHRYPARNVPVLACSKQNECPKNLTISSGKTLYPPCDFRYSEYTPCEDGKWGRKLALSKLERKERHCPIDNGKPKLLKCLVPAPVGYRRPFSWPTSRDYAWYVNVPHKHLTLAKAEQHWISFEGDRFRFPGGGTSFPGGAESYIDHIGKMINLRDGSIRVAVDTGCGVASWGAYLFSSDVLTMSFAPKDSHEAQVQFALERGVPAILGILATRRLPYPARAFDMAHCSRCLIPWTDNDGMYLMEVDRVLRPGGYWVLSGPPINWKERWLGWNRTRFDLQAEQSNLENLTESLCWRKLKEEDDIAIWQKPINHLECEADKRLGEQPPMCPQDQDPDQAWYTKMAKCLSRMPDVSSVTEVAGGSLMKWPKRLNAVPPRVSSGSLDGLTGEAYLNDSRAWNRRLLHYKSVNELLGTERYRNILDMNAYVGGFAAALADSPVWVMNVVPVHAQFSTLGVIYERGLIGTYQDWCEAMSTYPRTYDLIHGDSVFSLYEGRCEKERILLEMDRVLRPEGSAIIRDTAAILADVKKIADAMYWKSRIVDAEDGHKILFAEKRLLAATNEG